MLLFISVIDFASTVLFIDIGITLEITKRIGVKTKQCKFAYLFSYPFRLKNQVKESRETPKLQTKKGVVGRAWDS